MNPWSPRLFFSIPFLGCGDLKKKGRVKKPALFVLTAA
jgi:hypothetical protein